MKIRTMLCAALGAAALATTAQAQVTIINLTGATAFRAASNNAILNIMTLTGSGDGYNYGYAYVGTQGLNGSNRSIFIGTIPGIPGTTIVRGSWSGSSGGVGSLVNNSDVQVLVPSTAVLPAGAVVGTPVYESAKASFAFSDVAQVATEHPSPALVGTPVGVVPFMFVASKSAPATVDNMTDQIFETLYSTSSVPLSMLTGNQADASIPVGCTGRASTSGTRITMLAETGYGIAKPVLQFQPTISGTVPNATITDVGTAGNGGFSSNSFIRDIVQSTSEGFYIIGYLTISDALAAVAGGAREMKYNGVAYSEENVKNGKYSLWGYQQFYQKLAALTANEQTFKTALINAIPSTLTATGAGIPEPQMRVVRAGGDGGPIFPR